MRYFSARQRQDSKLWDYTVQHSINGAPLIEPVGYCAGTFESMWPALTEEQFNNSYHKVLYSYEQYNEWRNARLPVAHKYHDDGHSLPVEACECYREYLLDNAIDFNLAGKSNSEHDCEALDCNSKTNRAVLYNNYYHFWLCEEHRTRDVVATLAPEVAEIWSS